MFNKLCFWRPKRHAYEVFFCYIDVSGTLQTGNLPYATREKITMKNCRPLTGMRNWIEKVDGSIGAHLIATYPHPREAEREVTNVKFLSASYIDYDRPDLPPVLIETL